MSEKAPEDKTVEKIVVERNPSTGAKYFKRIVVKKVNLGVPSIDELAPSGLEDVKLARNKPDSKLPSQFDGLPLPVRKSKRKFGIELSQPPEDRDLEPDEKA